VAFAVFIVTVYTLHRWQRTTRAVQALPEGEKAYASQDWGTAAERLGSHLTVNHDNVDILIKYADAQLKRRLRPWNNNEQTIAAYRGILLTTFRSIYLRGLFLLHRTPKV
jgi:hypothetical protein